MEHFIPKCVRGGKNKLGARWQLIMSGSDATLKSSGDSEEGKKKTTAIVKKNWTCLQRIFPNGLDSEYSSYYKML